MTVGHKHCNIITKLRQGIDCLRPNTIDPSGCEAQQWDMYGLLRNPNETANLVQVGLTPPQTATTLPQWADPATVEAAIADLTKVLADLELRYL